MALISKLVASQCLDVKNVKIRRIAQILQCFKTPKRLALTSILSKIFVQNRQFVFVRK